MTPTTYTDNRNNLIPSAMDCEKTDQADDKVNKVKVFYNDECPVCDAEICHYQRLDTAADQVAFTPISQNPDALKTEGLTKEDIKRRLYAYDTNGTLLSGTDAFIAIWAELPSYRWLAKFTRLPVIYQIANVLYDYVAVPLLARWNQRRETK